MRLEKIHIAGFKSFVEPTSIQFPSHLVGVVGPNGCGKSNVIDAVRWVMGESSAKMLRGESMADVIFNGSSSRKPVGSASIELVFDNSEGRAGGQYAAYNQISVRRTLTRDGQSTYYLNASRCRRRDVTDLFLGTGLGPRSYSIIEQGMISRIIEARPEDLRLFLEEAAGISKYKERRRETETRMQHTRENLSRLNDLRDEVAKQLRHLEQQAATAERYKSLRQEERQHKASLLALRWQLLGAEVTEAEAGLASQTTAMEAATARLRSAETALEQGRETQIAAIDQVNEVQSRFYALGAEISRLEQRLRFGRDNSQRLEKELAAARSEHEALQGRMAEDETWLANQQQERAQAEPLLAGLQAQEETAARQQQEAEAALHQWQEAWDAFNRQAAVPVQAAQVERARIGHLERQVLQLEQRRQRLSQEQESMQLDADEVRLGQLQQELLEAEAANQAAEAAGQGLQQGLAKAREYQGQAQQEQQRLQLEASRLAGRLSSLEALRQAALGREQKQGISKGLQALGLSEAPRLAEFLQVPERWRDALDRLLGQRLRSVCVPSLDGLGGFLQATDAKDQQMLDFLECSDKPLPEETGVQAFAPNPDSLLTLLEPDQARTLAPWLCGVRLTENLAEALARRAELKPHECWLTPTGERVGPNWLMTGREPQTAGLLQREQELRELKAQQQAIQARQAEAMAALEQARAGLKEAEGQIEHQRQTQMQKARELAGIRSQVAGLKGRIEGLIKRRQSLEQELGDIGQQARSAQAELETARSKLSQALAEAEVLDGQRAVRIAEREGLQQAQSRLREQDLRLRTQVKEAALKLQALSSGIQSRSASLAQARERSRALEGRVAQCQADLGQLQAPLEQDQAELKTQLDQRLVIEQALSQARSAQSEQEQQLRQAEQERHQAEQGVNRARDLLEAARLHLQELQLRWTGLDEQLAETGLEPKPLLAALPAGAEPETLVIQLEKIHAKIERLGRVNLAAIDEFKEQSERMSYLEQQHQDISQALEVLEEAIRKIDKETRARFRETFDKVNTGLQAFFPRLFGGGHASLQLLGDDLLDTGVSVMARPPGKRNSSIQLLSGGEKALTAVALVFAIFELNPAPFCMLDEVDAPLDEANVGRFCSMVREMSDKVQFIFITHNKVTMELSSQLIGVTMHEPGVSRIVSVDIAEAVRMAAA